jgi:hypothetical protein
MTNPNVEMMKIFAEASSNRTEAVRNGDFSEAWKQNQILELCKSWWF